MVRRVLTSLAGLLVICAALCTVLSETGRKLACPVLQFLCYLFPALALADGNAPDKCTANRTPYYYCSNQ